MTRPSHPHGQGHRLAVTVAAMIAMIAAHNLTGAKQVLEVSTGSGQAFNPGRLSLG